MHSEHDALPVVASKGDSSLLVAATLAALVLAGSALVYCKTHEQSSRGKLTQPYSQSTPGNMDTERRQPLDAHEYEDASPSTHDPDSKDSKSSRSKDRRRRGKDPLKEILKGGKKVKSTATTPVKQLFSGKPILDDLDNHHLDNINNMPTPSTPAASFTSNAIPNSFSHGSSKRAQQDDSLVNLPATVDTTSSLHSRTISEVSQSNTGPRIPDQPHPHQHTRNRPASSTLIFEDRFLTPLQSSSSSQNGTEDNTNISEERSPDILSRQTHLAVPTPSSFSTIQNNDDLSETVNHSVTSSASSTTSPNTTTASCVITPATSPSLSYTSSKLIPIPSPIGDSSVNNDSGSACGPKNNQESEPSHGMNPDTKSRNISRKQQLLPTPSKSKSKTNASNTWEWNNAVEAVSDPPSSSSSISASIIASAPLSTPTSSLITAPAFPPDIVYRKPPRLQSSKNAKNDASSSLPGSVSHPSLLSPTSGSSIPPDSALISLSISSDLEKVPPSRVSKGVEEGESEEVEERDTPDDSYTQLEFPTLNPIVSTSSSVASNGNGGPITSSSLASPSSNQRPITPRRAHGSRRPPTPSGSTPPPHATASSASGSGSAQPPPTQTPAVSTQTQLASLRGALEASRLREEKHKAEMERLTKELEALRWENMNSRRGEVELQNHIRHLMHQLQMCTSLFASVSPQQQRPQQPQGPMAGIAELSNPGDGAALDPGSGNGPTTASSPGTQNVQSPATPVIPGPPVSSPGLPPMHLHMLPPLQTNSPVSASGVFPLPMPSIHAPSTYFPYPVPPPLHPHTVMPSPHPMFAQQFHHMQQQFLQFQQYQQHQPHMQNQSQSPIVQAQQANLISMLHPPSLATISSHQPYATSSSSSMASGSRSSSRPGTESAGSSPDLSGSPSPAPGTKRRTRTRTQTANGYIGGRVGWDDTSDGWVVGGVSIDEDDERGYESIYECEGQGENGGGDENEGEFNELLADAIFKRPGSIGVHSGKKSKQALLEKEKEKERGHDGEPEQLENEVLDAVESLTEFKFPSLSDSRDIYNEGHQSSSSASPVVVSQAPESLGPDIFDLQALADRSAQDIEAAVSQSEELGNRNDNQPSSDTASSSPDSERTPRREESEPNITELLMDLNRAEEATNVPQGQ